MSDPKEPINRRPITVTTTAMGPLSSAICPGSPRTSAGPTLIRSAGRNSATDSNNSYSALQMKVEKRSSRGLQVLGHYTWSRALDYDTTQYIYARAQGFGPNNTNRNHVITAMALWEVPVGRGRHALNNIPRALDMA